MRSNELRIGNLILIDGKIVSVFSIDEPDYGDNGLVNKIYSEYNGVPLTEEWLLTLGFAMNGGTYDYKNYFLIKKYDKWRVGIDEEGGITFTTMDFVHQVQNIIFALTGVELL